MPRASRQTRKKRLLEHLSPERLAYLPNTFRPSKQETLPWRVHVLTIEITIDRCIKMLLIISVTVHVDLALA